MLVTVQGVLSPVSERQFPRCTPWPNHIWEEQMKATTKHYLLIITIIIVGIITLSTISLKISIKPGYIADDKQATRQAIEKFHQLMAADDFNTIYQDAHELFKQTVSREQLFVGMTSVKQKYGRLVKVTSEQLDVIIGAPIQIRAIYYTTFQKGKAIEMFTYVKQNDDVKLVKYVINPRKSVH